MLRGFQIAGLRRTVPPIHDRQTKAPGAIHTKAGIPGPPTNRPHVVQAQRIPVRLHDLCGRVIEEEIVPAVCHLEEAAGQEDLSAIHGELQGSHEVTSKLTPGLEWHRFHRRRKSHRSGLHARCWGEQNGVIRQRRCALLPKCQRQAIYRPCLGNLPNESPRGQARAQRRQPIPSGGVRLPGHPVSPEHTLLKDQPVVPVHEVDMRTCQDPLRLCPTPRQGLSLSAKGRRIGGRPRGLGYMMSCHRNPRPTRCNPKGFSLKRAVMEAVHCLKNSVGISREGVKLVSRHPGDVPIGPGPERRMGSRRHRWEMRDGMLSAHPFVEDPVQGRCLLWGQMRPQDGLIERIDADEDRAPVPTWAPPILPLASECCRHEQAGDG